MKTKEMVFGIVREKCAFTLLEVMITLLLLSTLLITALPHIANSLAHFQTITTVRKLISDIQYTQQLATRSEDQMASYEIIFNPQLEQYSIRRGSKIIRTEKFPTWVDMAGTNLSQQGNQPGILTFSIQGNPVRAGTITIANKRSGKIYRVIIALLTGRVRVETS